MSNLKDEILEYVELKFQQLQFEGIEVYGKIRSKTLFKIALTFFLSTFVLFLTLTLAFYLNAIMESKYLGFGIVALTYLLISFICLIFRNTIINFLLKNYLNNNIPS